MRWCFLIVGFLIFDVSATSYRPLLDHYNPGESRARASLAEGSISFEVTQTVDVPYTINSNGFINLETSLTGQELEWAFGELERNNLRIEHIKAPLSLEVLLGTIYYFQELFQSCKSIDVQSLGVDGFAENSFIPNELTRLSVGEIIFLAGSAQEILPYISELRMPIDYFIESTMLSQQYGSKVLLPENITSLEVYSVERYFKFHMGKLFIYHFL